MKPKFSVHIDVITAHCVRINFSQPLCFQTNLKFTELQRYEGVTVYNKNTNTGILLVFTPVWDYKDVVEEVITLLVSEGFDEKKILVTANV